jgi:hypothetical protein
MSIAGSRKTIVHHLTDSSTTNTTMSITSGAGAAAPRALTTVQPRAHGVRFREMPAGRRRHGTTLTDLDRRVNQNTPRHAAADETLEGANKED